MTPPARPKDHDKAGPRGPHPLTILRVHSVPLPIDGEGELVDAQNRRGVRSDGVEVRTIVREIKPIVREIKPIVREIKTIVREIKTIVRET